MVVQCPAKRSAIFARQKDCSSVPELTFRWMSVCLCVSRSRSPKDSRAGWARRGRSSYLTEAVLRAEKCCFSPFLRWLSRVRGFKGRGRDFKGAPTALAVLTRSCLKLQHRKALDFRAWACGGLGKKKEGEEKKVDFFFVLDEILRQGKWDRLITFKKHIWFKSTAQAAEGLSCL